MARSFGSMHLVNFGTPPFLCSNYALRLLLSRERSQAVLLVTLPMIC